MNRLSISCLCFLLFILFISIQVGNAAVFDVSSGTELQTALTSAQDNDENDTINLAAGTYDASGGSFTYVPDNTASSEENFSLTLVGADVETTLLDGGSLQQVLNIDTSGLTSGDPDADITLQNLTIQNGTALTNGGGLIVATDQADVTVENCIFQNNTTTSFAAGADLLVNSGDIFVRDSRFLSNTAADDAGGAEFFVDDGSITSTNNIFFDNEATAGVGGGALIQFDNGDDAGGTLFIINNTFISNTAGDEGGGMLIGLDVDAESAEIFNNIIFGNTATVHGDDIFVDDDIDGNNTGSVVNIFNNDFTGLFTNCSGGCTTNVLEGNNLDADPLLEDPANGDFHLTLASPVIDQGDSAAPELPAEDFEGDDRELGIAPDMGADETPLCGDSIISVGEECDDGNTDDGDCCDSACQFEADNPCGGDGGCTLSGINATTTMSGSLVMALLLVLSFGGLLAFRRR